MALWGNKDSFSSGLQGTISINLNTGVVTGSGTTFITSGIGTGDVLIVGAGATYGRAVISGITSALVISIGSTSQLRPNGGSGIVGAAYTVSELPLYTVFDGNGLRRSPDSKTTGFSANPIETTVVGVSTLEQEVARDAGSKYRPAHAGWVGVTTYNDMHGTLRVKTETFVAGSSITNDAADDTKYPES